jgi:hypothetical protein
VEQTIGFRRLFPDLSLRCEKDRPSGWNRRSLFVVCFLFGLCVAKKTGHAGGTDDRFSSSVFCSVSALRKDRPSGWNRRSVFVVCFLFGLCVAERQAERVEQTIGFRRLFSVRSLRCEKDRPRKAMACPTAS